jgi:mRNA interferase YafQ
MYEIKRSKKFKSSYKRVSNSKHFPVNDFNHIVELLGSGSDLPDHFKDHALKGDSFGIRECHLANDCLLMYEIDQNNKSVRFMNIGNHSNLFE